VDLTVAQWSIVEPLFPEEERTPPGSKGGRPWRDPQDVLNGILWILRTGAPWADLPKRYPPYQTCHRRFTRWVESKLLPRMLAALYRDLRKRGGVEDVESFIDGTYVPAKKGGLALGSAVRARPPRSWRSRTAMVFHSLSLLSSPTDCRQSLVGREALTTGIVERIRKLQERLLEERGIELIAPVKKNSRRKQDGRSLRRYRRRWKVERLFAWLKRSRRLSTRWERRADIFLGFLQLGCVLLLLRRSAG